METVKSLLLCRTCLLEKNEEDMEEIYEMKDILKDIVPIELVKKDGWPNDICSDCVIQANQAYEFRVMCIKSDEILTERMTEKMKNSDIADNIDTKSADFICNSQAEGCCVKKEESSGLRVKNEEEDLGTLTKEDVPFEFCEIKQEEQSDKEEEFKVCEESEVYVKVEEYEMSAEEKINTDNDETDDDDDDETTICCVFCDMEFNNENDLEKHKQKHLKERICHYCNKHIESVEYYRKHVARHKRRGTYPCETCGKSFEFPDNLRSHQRIHTSDARIPYKCTKCDKTYILASSLKRHLANTDHSKVLPHVCNICQKRFSTANILNHHLKYQHRLPPDQRRPYVCACGKSFKEKQYLTQHETSVHSPVKKYKCDLCEKSYTCRQNLYYHKRTHKGIKPYVCHVCGYAFLYQCKLNLHMRVHPNQRETDSNK